MSSLLLETNTAFICALSSIYIGCLESNTSVMYLYTQVKVKQSRYRPRGFQEVKVPRFRDNITGWW